MRIKSHFDINGFALSLSRFETEALGNSEMAYLARMAIFNDNRTAMAHLHFITTVTSFILYNVRSTPQIKQPHQKFMIKSMYLPLSTACEYT